MSGAAAVEHLEEAVTLIDDPIRRGETVVLIGRELEYLDRVDESVKVLRQALGEVTGAGTDVELERVLEAVWSKAASSNPASTTRPVGGCSVFVKTPMTRPKVERCCWRCSPITTPGRVRRPTKSWSWLDAPLPAGRCSEARSLRMRSSLRAPSLRGPTWTRFRRCTTRRWPRLTGADRFWPSHRRLHRGQMFLFRGDLADAEVDVRRGSSGV